MDQYRKVAKIVGWLFIIALVLNVVGMGIYDPILKDQDFLNEAYPNRFMAIIGLLIDFICVPAIVLIPVFLFPILKKENESLALGYVGFRFLEGILFLFGLINSLSLISLSRDFLNSGMSDVAFYQTLGNSIQATGNWSTHIYIFIFTLGASIFYYLLNKSQLVPRFLSVWGILGAIILFTGTLLSMLGLISLSQAMNFFAPPIGLNELALSIWLIAKGFNPTKLESGV